MNLTMLQLVDYSQERQDKINVSLQDVSPTSMKRQFLTVSSKFNSAVYVVKNVSYIIFYF